MGYLRLLPTVSQWQKETSDFFITSNWPKSRGQISHVLGYIRGDSQETEVIWGSSGAHEFLNREKIIENNVSSKKWHLGPPLLQLDHAIFTNQHHQRSIVTVWWYNLRVERNSSARRVFKVDNTPSVLDWKDDIENWLLKQGNSEIKSSLASNIHGPKQFPEWSSPVLQVYGRACNDFII